MKKILIQQNKVFHYRKGLFNELSKFYDVTVIHSGEKVKDQEDTFNEVISPTFNFLSFRFQKSLLKQIRTNNYDSVILLFNFYYISNFISLIRFKQVNFILWGPWINGSKIRDYFRLKLMKYKYKIVLYSRKHFFEFVSLGIDKEKMYVANNTINVNPRNKCFLHEEKKSLLFVGSFDSRKQLDVLVDVFNTIKNEIPADVNLTLIGNGDNFSLIQKMIKDYELNNRIFLKGKITDNSILAEEYNKAIISVSLGQAGLSVLQSFGFGVPFLTKKNAISGGETSNIVNDFNGVLCESDLSDLNEKLILICNNIDYALKLGENAYSYYDKYCTIENMANGFKDAIDNTRISEIDIN